MTARTQVLAIGSCRVFRPLRPHHVDGRIELLNYLSHQWFTHTVASGQQFAEAITGKLAIPEDLRPYVCETALTLPPDLSGAETFRPDVVIFEVSSLKIYETAGIALNAHLLRNRAQEAGLDSAAFLKDPRAVDRAGTDIPDIDLRNAGQDDFELAIGTISKLFGAPIVVVNHLFYRPHEGAAELSGRPEITQMLSAIAANNSQLAFYDTRETIETIGNLQALKDPQHYRPEAEAQVGEAILDHASSFIGP